MLKNIYTPLSGSLAQERVMEIIANNLANASTNGFKEESVTFKLLPPEPYKNYKNPLPPANYKIPFEDVLPIKGNDMAYVGVSGVSRNDSQGPVVMTKNPLDLMIEGDGYLSVMTREGLRYTRNGSLSMNGQGALTDKAGNPVIGEKGDIFLRSGQPVQINRLGEIYQGDELIDRLVIYSFKDPSRLEQVGFNNYFYNGHIEERQVEAFPTITQGALEGSNVNAMKNLTQMIVAHRSFEAYQQAIKNFDSMMERASNTIGEVRA